MGLCMWVTEMSDDLRTRIAAAIYKGCDNRVSPGLSRQAADVVIREIGLRREGHPSETITNEQGATFYREGGHRYVTEWIADE